MLLLLILLIMLIICLLPLHANCSNNKLDHKECLSMDMEMSIENAQKHMTEIAVLHKKTMFSKSNKNIINLLLDSWKSFKSKYKMLVNVEEKIIQLIPAALWLVDNFYMIEREVKYLTQILRQDCYKKLPVLEDSEHKGVQRIYLLAGEILNCTGYHIDEETIINLLNSYQSVNPLTHDEILVFTDMLKLCIVEKINRIASDVVESVNIKSNADKIMDDIINSYSEPEDYKVSDKIEKLIPNQSLLLNATFITHVLYYIKELSIDDELLKKWFVDKLNKNETDLGTIIKAEGQLQSKLQICIGSLVTSLREITGISYEHIFKSISYIEKILKEEPIKLYEKMDFDTKIHYHRKIKKIAKQTNSTECEVANWILELSKQSFKKKGSVKESHVGYYLFKEGINNLYKNLNYKYTLLETLKKIIINIKGVLYFSSIFLLSIFTCFLGIIYTDNRNPQGSIALLILSGFILIVPAITISIEIVNFLSLKLVKPKQLPSMDFSDGVPDNYKTIVVMPVVIGGVDQVNKYIEKLETYHIANKDNNICFGLLADCRDGNSKNLDDDEKIINAAVDGISELNRKYSKERNAFYIFVRERSWNQKQNCWMGWERKRGILEQFNKLLLGIDDGCFTTLIGNKEELKSFTYVITIDAGTELVRDSASKLIGLMAHPLNKPVLNSEKTIVIDGYTIIQPKIGIRIANSSSSYFSKLFSGQAGIDTYPLCVSDVYQDVFGKSTFGGKGIYDPKVFHEVMGKTIPENSVLSHDLLESCYVQCAFASNVELMDDFPTNIASYFTREHRWIRGDWQLLRWFFNRNSLSILSKYKIFDNLRRSIVPASYLILIFLAVSVLPWEFYFYGTIILFTTLFPLIINVSKTTMLVFKKYTSLFNIYNNAYLIGLTLIQGIFWFMILPYRAYTSVDAILRTLYRLYFSKMKMLEWKTAEAAERSLKNNLKSYFIRMWISILSGGLLIVFSNKISLAYSIAIAVLWGISPIVSYYLSKGIAAKKIKLSDKENSDIRLVARKTWRFFDDFFTTEDNFLIPDNFQEWPQNGIAHRTSTTNIGLEMLCILSAYDFGFITFSDMISRLEKVLMTLDKLQKWNGHFYNWYDTKNLEPLLPRYVSTVDSGNFIGCLVTLRKGINEVIRKPILGNFLYNGLLDTLKLAKMELKIEKPSSVEEWIALINKIKENSNSLGEIYWIRTINKFCDNLLNDIKSFGLADNNYIVEFASVDEHDNYKKDFKNRVQEILNKIDTIIDSINFKPLYDAKRDLFMIGFNVTTNSPDNSYYDLLASEARLASFLAIARGEVPQKHWFKLGRTITLIEGIPTLVSWSGTMFEYLMPNLLMRLIPNSLISQTSIGAIKQQINYGERKKTPWGMSEAAYYRFDQHLNYQYRAIGVPGLGFSTDLGRFLVIAPYATMLAFGIHPKEAYKNLLELRNVGAEGDYGFYEAVDYITSKEDKYRKQNVVKSFFAHHQGMTLIALSNYINCNNMQDRFHMDPLVKSTELLLEEKKPQYIIIRDKQQNIVPNNTVKKVKKPVAQRIVKFTRPNYPIAHILSNNQYTVMITSTGTGQSWCKDTAINRWRPDVSCDNLGTFIYIKSLDSHKYWSSAFQPAGTEPDSYESIFMLDKAEFKRKDGEITTTTEIIVSPQDNLEIRRVTLTNNGSKDVNIEVTSYTEAVIDSYENDLAHPAFNKLFVETEYIQEKQMLIATRRPRTSNCERKWVMHTVLVDGKAPSDIEFETDRSKFIGRGNTLRIPDAVTSGLNMSNTVGKVLDCILSLKVKINIPTGKSRTVTYLMGIEETRQKVINMVDVYSKPHSIEDAFKMSLFNSELEMQYLDITPQQANSVQDIVGSIYYPSSLMRCSSEIICQNKLSQRNLWRFGISGDYPIILLKITDASELDAVKDMILAYEYLKIKGVKADLVVLNEQNEGYFQELSNKIRDMLTNIKVFENNIKNSGAFLLQSSYMTKEEIILIHTVAVIVLTGKNRLLSKRLRSIMLEQTTETNNEHYHINNAEYPDIALPEENLEYFNGLGGFTKDGREYVITLKDKTNTPNPWINVIANNKFGFNVSSTGSGYTWSVNSRENKITKWSNDPVTDQPSEVIYIRDEQTGRFFTPTPLPVRESSQYNIHHGFGYSVFLHNSMGLRQKMTVFAALNEPLKLYKVSLENDSEVARELSIIFYCEIVMGVVREKTAPFIVTKKDSELDILTAINTYNDEFAGNITFVCSSEKLSSYTADRGKFLGKSECLYYPKGIRMKELGNETGAGLDPCFAVKVNVNLEPGENKDVVLFLGTSDNSDKINEYTAKYKSVAQVDKELKEINNYWYNILNKVKVATPDLTTNLLLNGWLIYQVLSCRIMARSGFYQASGAFGFRDQLQDSLSLLHCYPDLTKQMIIGHSKRQFVEGDVQHWWHEDSGKGVRTKTSDDLLWLPYVTCLYIEYTNDYEILELQTQYLVDSELKENEHDRYSIPNISESMGTIYEHCVKAIERSLQFGTHGLPLIGSGDWNDGMSKIGIGGRGESVWLGWFLYDVLNRFIPMCKNKGDIDRAEKYAQISKTILNSIEANCWDGEWYIRAFFDNGMPIGSKHNTECKIDAISQSWSAITGGASNDRALTAMESVLKYLVNDENQIVLLLTPPFDKMEPDPGYIRGYIPGIRENGGQYTHAAVWNILAFAKLRKGDTAYKLFKMLNPINHTLTYTDVMKYKNEPYVMSADVYSTPPHNGRGGWSWYTGAASWMYKAGMEELLGIKKKGETLIIDPNIPKEWPEYTVEYIYKDTRYVIVIQNPNSVNFGVLEVVVDGVSVPERTVKLIDDNKIHNVIVKLG